MAIMNWYYVDQGKQAGPVSDEQFNGLIQNGAITAETLVWREGMADWLPCGQVRTPGATGATATATETAPQVVCVECRKMFPADETIRYGDMRVCGSCKPVFLQKLQEGAQLQAGALHYAGFWIRWLACFLDFVILIGVCMIIRLITLAAAGAFIAGVHGVHGRPALLPIAMAFFLGAFQYALPIAYETLMVGRYGATLGKMALKLKVVVADGEQVSFARAFGRCFAKMLSGCFTLYIGRVIAAFDNPEKRALHDYICNTRVVHK